MSFRRVSSGNNNKTLSSRSEMTLTETSRSLSSKSISVILN
jgi:hypothetical protein